MLEPVAAAGHPAVSFDEPFHGARADNADPWALAIAALAEFRRQMRPILGRTTLEAMRVLHWVQDRSANEVARYLMRHWTGKTVESVAFRTSNGSGCSRRAVLNLLDSPTAEVGGRSR